MVTIRRATRDDAERITDIFASAVQELAKEHYNAIQIEKWSGGFSVGRTRERIQAGGMFVDEVGGEVAGFVEISLADGGIEMVYVSPESARRGIGSAMMRYVEALALDSGLKNLHLRESLNAVPFYEAMGFVTTEKVIHCNAQGIEFECAIMEKQLA